MRLLTSPYLLMTLAMLCWAGNWLLARALRADITPIGLNFWRWLVALLLLLPFALPRFDQGVEGQGQICQQGSLARLQACFVFGFFANFQNAAQCQ